MPIAVGAVSPPRRPALITVLAILQFIGGTIGVLVGLAAVGSTIASDGGGPEAFVGLLLGGLGALKITCGVGLWKLKPYGRTLQLVGAWIGLIGIPIGTIISILILIYLFKPGVKALFSGKPVNELTAEELAQIAAVTQGSMVTVVVVLLVVSIAAVGIIAAIAVPGLLRARMAGNEASAIGSLRTINGAQAAFSSACGNGFYAPTLASLATPPQGQQVGFLSDDLASDPLVRSGYTITLVAGDPVPNAPVACTGTTVVKTYFASAEPVTLGSSGARFFATNQAGTVFHSTSAIPATHEGAPDDATPVQ